jgi:hypothetical protein
MHTIKFSYPFPKLFGEDNRPIQVARLLQVIDIDLSDLTAEMRAYDTANGAYTLPAKGAYLMLIFQKPGSIHLFITLRRSTPEKRDYYTRLVGERFTVQINPAQ